MRPRVAPYALALSGARERSQSRQDWDLLRYGQKHRLAMCLLMRSIRTKLQAGRRGEGRSAPEGNLFFASLTQALREVCGLEYLPTTTREIRAERYLVMNTGGLHATRCGLRTSYFMRILRTFFRW